MELKFKRVRAGISQLELSLRARVSRWRLGLAERDAIQLRPDEVARIERALKKYRRSMRPVLQIVR